MTEAAAREFSSGFPRVITAVDDRYLILKTRKDRRQTAGEIAKHIERTTVRPISRFTRARRLHKVIYLFDH